jgi:hypothetical protein
MERGKINMKTLTQIQINALDHALELARYFVEEHEGGITDEQWQKDKRAYETALKIVQRLEASCTT